MEILCPVWHFSAPAFDNPAHFQELHLNLDTWALSQEINLIQYNTFNNVLKAKQNPKYCLEWEQTGMLD